MVDILKSDTRKSTEYPDFSSLTQDFPGAQNAIEQGRSTIKQLMTYGGVIDTYSGTVLTMGNSGDEKFANFINDEQAPKKAMREGHRGVFIFQYNELMARLGVTVQDLNELFQRQGMGNLDDRGKGFIRQTVRIVLPHYFKLYSKFGNMHVSYQTDFAGIVSRINEFNGVELRDKKGNLLDRCIVRLAFEEVRRDNGLDVTDVYSFNVSKFKKAE
jgi:hypothetical protein